MCCNFELWVVGERYLETSWILSLKQSVIFLAGIESSEVKYLSIPAKLLKTMSIFSCFPSDFLANLNKKGTPVRKSIALQLPHKEVPESGEVGDAAAHPYVFHVFHTSTVRFLCWYNIMKYKYVQLWISVLENFWEWLCRFHLKFWTSLLSNHGSNPQRNSSGL